MELQNDLGLEQLSRIIKILEASTDVEHLKGEYLECNGILYNYEKNGDELTISDSLGNKTVVKISYRESVDKNPLTGEDKLYAYEDIAVDYLFKNGGKIHIDKTIGLNVDLESYRTPPTHDLLSDIITSYYDSDGKEVASFNLSLDSICLKEPEVKVEFTGDGIKCENKVVSINGESLLSLNGDSLPSKETFESFNLSNEQEKIANFLQLHNDFHPFTRELLNDAIKNLERKGRYASKIMSFYNHDLHDIRKAIEYRKEIGYFIENETVKQEGLELVASDLAMSLKDEDRNRMLGKYNS